MSVAPQPPGIWKGMNEESAWTAGWYAGQGATIQAQFKELDEAKTKLAEAKHDVEVWRDQLVEVNLRARMALHGIEPGGEIKPSETEVRVCFRLMQQIHNLINEVLKRAVAPKLSLKLPHVREG